MRASSVNTAILEVLAQEAPAHMAATEIYEKIRRRLPAVNPSTVYRALDRLAKAGSISVSDMGGGAVVYETLAQPRHHHLVCQVCGRVYDVEHQDVDAFFSSLQAKHEFTIATNHLVLFGTCSLCRNSSSS